MSRSRFASLLIAILLCGVGSVATPAAPVPKAPAKISVDKLKSLLGKSHLSKEVHELRKSIDELPVAHYFVGGIEQTSFFHSWYDHGLSVQFDENGNVSNLFLYLESREGFKEYTGDLPNGLERKDKSKDVRKQLGEPEMAHDSKSPRVNAWWEYPKKGITVNFSSPTADDQNSVIGVLVLCKPEAK